jgi:hypothetical protein
MNTFFDEDIFPFTLQISDIADSSIHHGKNAIALHVFGIGKGFTNFNNKIKSLVGQIMGLQCKQRKNGPIYYEMNSKEYYTKYNLVVKAISIYFKEISDLNEYGTLRIILRNHEDVEKFIYFLKNLKETNSNFVLANKFELI